MHELICRCFSSPHSLSLSFPPALHPPSTWSPPRPSPFLSFLRLSASFPPLSPPWLTLFLYASSFRPARACSSFSCHFFLLAFTLWVPQPRCITATPSSAARSSDPPLLSCFFRVSCSSPFPQPFSLSLSPFALMLINALCSDYGFLAQPQWSLTPTC